MMKAESFEYAIKKDVRNNPIVREVDNERHREMWRSLMVGAFVVVALVFFAWHRLELRSADRNIGDLNRQLAAQEQKNKELRLELATRSSLQQIEDRAKTELGMKLPEEYKLIELVPPSPLPGKTVMARR